MAKRQPLKALIWTEEQIDELTAITDADIEAAAQFWRDNAPAALADLLDALPPDFGVSSAVSASSRRAERDEIEV